MSHRKPAKTGVERAIFLQKGYANETDEEGAIRAVPRLRRRLDQSAT